MRFKVAFCVKITVGGNIELFVVSETFERGGSNMNLSKRELWINHPRARAVREAGGGGQHVEVQQQRGQQGKGQTSVDPRRRGSLYLVTEIIGSISHYPLSGLAVPAPSGHVSQSHSIGSN